MRQATIIIILKLIAAVLWHSLLSDKPIWYNIMQTAKTITAALVGTTFMTLFSYWISSKKRKQFREPELLDGLLQRLPVHVPATAAQVSGWLIHYGVGFSFCAIYDAIWKHMAARPSVTNGMMLGGISGLVGILGWHAVLSFHPNPPAVEIKKYYGHLMLAHVIFGVFSVIGYRLPYTARRVQRVAKKPDMELMAENFYNV
jgi:hypothetical protein